MYFENIQGVPDFECNEWQGKTKEYCVLIPIINEGERIKKELQRAKHYRVSDFADIVICDGGSTDGCTEERLLKSLCVNTLLVKKGPGKQGAQLRMGIWWALQRGYKGVITIDGNNKDSIEDVPAFIEKLQEEAKSNEYLNKLKEEDNYEEIKEALLPKEFNFIVTPKEIDELIEKMSKLISYGINMSL